MATLPDAAGVLEGIERLAAESDLPIIGPEKGSVLVDSMEQYQPLRVLEIGTLVGYSSILMGRHLPNGGSITTIELDKGRAATAREHFRKAGLSDRIIVLTGPALKVIPRLRGPYDMLFLDAAKNEYYRYLKAAEPKLSKLAVVVADNV